MNSQIEPTPQSTIFMILSNSATCIRCFNIWKVHNLEMSDSSCLDDCDCQRKLPKNRQLIHTGQSFRCSPVGNYASDAFFFNLSFLHSSRKERSVGLQPRKKRKNWRWSLQSRKKKMEFLLLHMDYVKDSRYFDWKPVGTQVVVLFRVQSFCSGDPAGYRPTEEGILLSVLFPLDDCDWLNACVSSKDLDLHVTSKNTPFPTLEWWVLVTFTPWLRSRHGLIQSPMHKIFCVDTQVAKIVVRLGRVRTLLPEYESSPLISCLFIACSCTQVGVGREIFRLDSSEDLVRTEWKWAKPPIAPARRWVFIPGAWGPAIPTTFMIANLLRRELTSRADIGRPLCRSAEQRCRTWLAPSRFDEVVLYSGSVVPIFARQYCTQSALSQSLRGDIVVGRRCPDLCGGGVVLGRRRPDLCGAVSYSVAPSWSLQKWHRTRGTWCQRNSLCWPWCSWLTLMWLWTIIRGHATKLCPGIPFWRFDKKTSKIR